ncbi:MAG: CNNM domain-containing protein [Holosporaceae bacterium]|jgi:Mg2+/Co2+ transporter CorB|nr:CNNM domain-containing protein [Holosporaceae bacterium]
MIILAGFVSGSETAVTRASRAYLFHLAKKGDERAKKVISLQRNLSTSISTILVLNQLILYLIPIISTIFSVKYLSTAEAAIMQTCLAALIMIYSEIFPKMLVIRFTTQFALFVAPFFARAVVVLRPITMVLEWCAKYTLRMLRIDVDPQESGELSDDELRGAIEMRQSDGDDEKTQKKSMLKSILDLEKISVSHSMIHRKNLKTINISQPIGKIADELSSCQFSRVPLWKDNPENIVGVLKTKTFFRALRRHGENQDSIQINQLMFPPWFVPDTKHLLDQLQDFRKKREHFALVVDEYGDLQGCITLEDILEEIVGEIVDEDDSKPNDLKMQDDGSVIVEGSMSIRDLNREFDWNLPEDDAATIAGYIMHEVRKIPDVGQIYILGGVKIEILKRQRNQIGIVKITQTLQTKISEQP